MITLSLCARRANLASNEEEKAWIWQNDGNSYYFDKHERVRFRVEEEHWSDAGPAEDADAGMRPPGPAEEMELFPKGELANSKITNGVNGQHAVEDEKESERKKESAKRVETLMGRTCLWRIVVSKTCVTELY